MTSKSVKEKLKKTPGAPLEVPKGEIHPVHKEWSDYIMDPRPLQVGKELTRFIDMPPAPGTKRCPVKIRGS